VVAQAIEGCSPEPAGRPLEAPGNGVSRWMVAAVPPLATPRRWGTESGLQANSSAPPGGGAAVRALTALDWPSRDWTVFTLSPRRIDRLA
jgi:hypothetical protein